MKKAGLIIISFFWWTFFVITSIFFLLIGLILKLITHWFDKRLVILHLFSSFWAACYIWNNPLWRVRIRGRKKIPWNRPCVMVSNHQSMVDILVLYSLFRPYKWVSKKENFKIPVLGWQMRMNEYLEIDRGRRDSLLKMMNKSGETLQKGSSILIFPEGTRSETGSMGPFREGAFKLAIDNKVDIIPIVLDGTAKAIPKSGVLLTGFSDIRARVLDPIPYSSFEKKSSRDLSNEIREMMSKEILELQNERSSLNTLKENKPDLP